MESVDEFLAGMNGIETTHQWEFSQMFGEGNEPEAGRNSDSTDGNTDNWISALKYDGSGTYLAVGYNCGQVVVLYQQDEHTYQLCCEFKSHESEFDCLTSTEIEEKINVIEWFPYSGGNPIVMTSNDKTIKLFRIGIPQGMSSAPIVRTRRTFKGGHSYNINSLSFNCDGETFLSSDDLCINMWHLGIESETFNIVDIKPENMENLQEVITHSAFHPTQCNLFMYSTSKGVIRMGDLRDSSLCDQHCKEFHDPSGSIGGFFQELVATVSDCKFSPNGHFILSRDYLTMKIWDLRKETQPVRTIQFHDHLIPQLCDLYESDSIFDKFECCWKGDSSQVLTGSYNGDFFICDTFSSNNTTQLSVKANGGAWPGDFLDTTHKVLHMDWHPTQDIIALGAKDYGYIYIGSPSGESEYESTEESS